jgi:hypothetical protein
MVMSNKGEQVNLVMPSKTTPEAERKVSVDKLIMYYIQFYDANVSNLSDDCKDTIKGLQNLDVSYLSQRPDTNRLLKQIRDARDDGGHSSYFDMDLNLQISFPTSMKPLYEEQEYNARTRQTVSDFYGFPLRVGSRKVHMFVLREQCCEDYELLSASGVNQAQGIYECELKPIDPSGEEQA